jgi:hypothetical protein
MKFNLGCGSDVREGYVNVDFRMLKGIDVVADLSKFPWPFADGCAEEVLMFDFLEHFPYRQTNEILLEVYRILAPEGTVVIQVPDAEHLTAALSMKNPYLCNSCGNPMAPRDSGEFVDSCGRCGQSVSSIAEAAMKRLYGGQDYPGNFHQTCFTKDMLCEKTSDCGLRFDGWQEERHQFLNWNFKGRFKMGDVW